MKHERYEELIDAVLDRDLTASEQAELQHSLRDMPAARQRYWQAMMQDALLRDLLRENRGQDLALVETSTAQDLTTRLNAVPCDADGPRPYRYREVLFGFVAAAVLIAIIFWNNSPASLAAPLGKLQSLSGQVSIRETNGQLTPAISGTIVRYGQAILVESQDSSAELQLDDGSILLVEADSVLVLPSSASAITSANEHARPRFYLERGGVCVQANIAPTQQPLLLTTAQALIKVLGTECRLYSDAHESRLELNEGSVQLCRQADQQEIVVSAGEYATIPATLVNRELEPLAARSLSTAKCELQQTLLRAGRAARLSWDGQTLATVRGRELRLWDLKTGEVAKKLTNLAAIPEQLAFRPDSQSILGITQRGQVLHWALDQSEPTLQQLPVDAIRMAYLAADGSMLAQAITSKPARIQLWSLAAAPHAPIPQQPVAAKPWSVAVSPAGSAQTTASAQWNGEIELYAAASGKLLERWSGNGSARPIEISSQSRFVAGYSSVTGLTLYKRQAAGATGSEEGQLLWSHLGSRVRCLKFSQDEKLILAAFDDGLVRAWSTQSGEMLLVLQTGDPRVFDFDLSADSKTLVTVGHNESVKIWDCVWPELLEGV